MSAFQKATKQQARLRMAITGPSGSGKTFSALAVAAALAGEQRVAMVDTEHGSAAKYADRFDFDVVTLESFHPQKYIDMIHEAEGAGYGVLVIDSLSHAWNGVGGALELVDQAASANRGNSYTAWKSVTPLHNALIQAIVSSKIHIIATMRSKTAYVVEQNGGGKSAPRKVGMEAIQRDGMEYEFDVVGEMNQEHALYITKSRCSAIADQVIALPGAGLAAELSKWLSDGVAPPEPVAPELEVLDMGAHTDDLRAWLKMIKSFQPDHPQRRELVEELKRRAAMAAPTAATTTPPPAAPAEPQPAPAPTAAAEPAWDETDPFADS